MTPPLCRIHSDQTLDAGVNRVARESWRTQATVDSVHALPPGQVECLTGTAEGRLRHGNTRLTVRAARGVDLDRLPRAVWPSREGVFMPMPHAMATWCHDVPHAQRDFVLQLAHRLTMIARDTYAVGQEKLSKSAQLHRMNEGQCPS